MKLVYLASMALLLCACASSPQTSKKPVSESGGRSNAATAANCDFERLPGRVFQFRPAAPDLQQVGYPHWQVDLNRTAEVVAYDTYTGRQGKLQPATVEVPGAKWGAFAAILDDCSNLYAKRIIQDETPAELELRAGIYFADTRAAVEPLIGQTFWLKRWPGSAKSRALITADPTVKHPWRTFEKVRLVAIEPQRFSHARGEGPFLVEVELANGARGLLHWNEAYLTAVNPVSPHWSDEFVTSIQQGRLLVGMPANAVRASWGEPLKINQSPTAGTAFEQWVYPNGYAYIRGGFLVSSQNTR